MVDDDVAFQQLGPERTVGHHTHLLFRVARFWSSMPGQSVVLGTFTGDPPVPMMDGLAGQLLISNTVSSVSSGGRPHPGPQGTASHV